MGFEISISFAFGSIVFLFSLSKLTLHSWFFRTNRQQTITCSHWICWSNHNKNFRTRSISIAIEIVNSFCLANGDSFGGSMKFVKNGLTFKILNSNNFDFLGWNQNLQVKADAKWNPVDKFWTNFGHSCKFNSVYKNYMSAEAKVKAKFEFLSSWWALWIYSEIGAFNFKMLWRFGICYKIQ